MWNKSRSIQRRVLAGMAGLVLAGCLGPIRRPESAPGPKGVESPLPSAEPTPAEGMAPVEVPTEAVVPSPAVVPAGRAVALWVPGPRVDPLAAAEYLVQRPWVRITAVFREDFFGDEEKSRRAKFLFQTLVSSRQVEVVLSLPERPVLPLIMDTQNAVGALPEGTALPPTFAWPEDVSDQVGVAQNAFRRRWRSAPGGIELPWGVVLGPELDVLAKLRLNWALLPSTGTAAAWIKGGALPVVRPEMFPSGTSARKEWFESRARGIVSSSATVGPFQIAMVEDTALFEGLAGGSSTFKWATLSETLAARPEGLDVTELPKADLSPWIGDAEENKAWALLGQVRRAVSDYQNSGAATMSSLELAKRMVHHAENGRFFYNFGAEDDQRVDVDVWRDFAATLTQVYTILGIQPPPEVRGAGGASGAGPSDTVDGDSGFEKVGSVLRWRDPLHDDRGPGDYFYPGGSQFPTGSWDLTSFEVGPDTGSVVFSFELAALPNPGRAPAGFSLPLIDLYIDINRSAGAGAQEFLPGRPGIAESSDAWEYALSVDGWGAKLFQHVPGQGPRVAATLTPVKSGSWVRVTVPRRYFRGDPQWWGYAVVVMGRAASGSTPMPVDVEPAPDRFGGAVADRSAPPYIDILVPPGQSQRRVLSGYKLGQEITIPFVRADL